MEFFSQFDVIVSALDNVRARAHLGKMAVKAGKPMVDGGTMGFHGQTMVFQRGATECYNCRPIPQNNEESFAVCTIRNTPERPIHCIVYAKNFYDCFFGGDQENSFKGDIRLEEFMRGEVDDEAILRACKEVFDALFYHRISSKLELDSLQHRSTVIHPLRYEEALAMTETLTNPGSTFDAAEDRRQRASPYECERLWSVAECARRFVRSMFNILKQRADRLGSLTFDKDDDDCMMLVYCVTTLRTYNFMVRAATGNKHKYLTYYDCKDKAGRIIPAIASTNAIAAATELQEVVKLVGRQFQLLNCVVFGVTGDNKLNGSEMNTANLNCEHCSGRSHNLRVECDFGRRTWGELEEFCSRVLSYGREMYSRARNGDNNCILDRTPATQPNRSRTLASFDDYISERQTMEVNFIPDECSELALAVFLRHRDHAEGFAQLAGSTPQGIRQELLRHKRAAFEKRREQRARDCRDAGWR